MKIKNYSFAGVEYQIIMPEEIMYTDERFLAPFAVETVEKPHIFNFDYYEELTQPTGQCVAKKPGFRVYSENGASVRYIGSVDKSWENAYIRAEHKDYNHNVQLKKSQFTDRVGTHTVLSSLAAEHLIAQAGGVVYHCSYIEHNGEAILFTAPSETGKSTQADLWNKYRGAQIINGDRAAIRNIDGKIYACGIPFAGSSKYCKNLTLPLKAVVYLAQAPVTTIKRIKGYRAFSKVWEGISVNTWDKDDMEKVSTLAKNIVENIPVYYLACTPDESAVIALEKALEGEI